MTRVLVTAPFPQPLMDKIRAVSQRIDIEQIDLSHGKWPGDKTTQAEVLYAIGDVPDPKQAPNLRWLQTHWAGVEHLRDKPIWESDVQITSASGIHAPILGQYVMAQMLAWTHKVPRWLKYQRKGEWPEARWDKFLPNELRDQTLGILGYGSIGREVARLAKCYGMTVLATKRNARKIVDEGFCLPGIGDPEGEKADRIYPGEATGSMVGECDFVVITLPLTNSTHHLIDEEMLRRMQPNCYVINIGRGSVIVEPDLVKALKRGWIAGAGLDVFEKEPLPEDSPLWSMENVIISPHVSGFTPHYDERVTDLFAENLRRFLALERLLNIVNRENGY